MLFMCFLLLVFVRFVYVSSKSFILYDIKNTFRNRSKLTWDKDSTKKYKYLKKKEHINIKNKKVQLWHNDALTMIYNTNMSMTSWFSKTSSFRLIHTAQVSYLFSNFHDCNYCNVNLKYAFTLLNYTKFLYANSQFAYIKFTIYI